MFNIKFFKSKKAVVFGMDARVTLMVTSILMLVVGYNIFVSSEKKNINIVKTDLQMIKIATLNFYEDNYSVPTVQNLLERKYLSLKDNINSDPWGVSYHLESVTNEEIFNSTKVNTKYMYAISYGNDGVKNTTEPTTKAEWEALVAGGDDIILKFDSLKIEDKLTKMEFDQLEIVKFLLETYVNKKESENTTFCNIISNQTEARCDVNQDGKYDYREELNLNYMPKEISDANGKYYLTINSVHLTQNIFKSGYINSTVNDQHNMYSFMNLIEGPKELVISPRNLVLHFDSNIYKNTQTPYFAKVWYGEEQTVY